MEEHDDGEVLRAERLWIESRGGSEWLSRYVRPFYMNWMRENPTHRDASVAQIPELRARAFELDLDEISAMLSMQWRIQVVATWCAIARADSRLSGAVHNGFAHCYGTLTAPALITAALVYPNVTTATALRAYRECDNENKYGGHGLVSAALRRISAEAPLAAPTEDDGTLVRLLEISHQLQQLSEPGR
ncbi:hypothetical protein ASF88_17765 [Leifsonia sp. Leaf336]|uniref:hypothetical protein n=1 Tax=Leifsonia sp. Leaf336 TaxID=1736341 RepID=UPI0006FA3CFB|nr:hypothetical protein [Leifsonia sp. Leaf336]KQR51043.1 hypothetical protein ASF88_17765 [Leifsonia sp. Leaf336]